MLFLKLKCTNSILSSKFRFIRNLFIRSPTSSLTVEKSKCDIQLLIISLYPWYLLSFFLCSSSFTPHLLFSFTPFLFHLFPSPPWYFSERVVYDMLPVVSHAVGDACAFYSSILILCLCSICLSILCFSHLEIFWDSLSFIQIMH